MKNFIEKIKSWILAVCDYVYNSLNDSPYFGFWFREYLKYNMLRSMITIRHIFGMDLNPQLVFRVRICLFLCHLIGAVALFSLLLLIIYFIVSVGFGTGD